MAFVVFRCGTRFGTVISRRYAPSLQNGCFHVHRKMCVKQYSFVNHPVPVLCGTSHDHIGKLLESSRDAVFAMPIIKRHAHDDTTKAAQTTESVIEETEKFKIVFRYTFIVHAKVLSRLKIYQTGITVLTLPVLTYMYMYSMGSVTAAFLAGTYGIATLAAVMLYVISFAVQHIVGILYVDRGGERLRVSHLSFWGKRVETFLNMSDVIPLTDTNQNINDPYVLLQTYDGKYKFYMFHTRGQVHDKEALMNVLGQVSNADDWASTDVEKINKEKSNRD